MEQFLEMAEWQQCAAVLYECAVAADSRNIFETFPSEWDCRLDPSGYQCEVVNKTKGRSIYSLIFNF